MTFMAAGLPGLRAERKAKNGRSGTVAGMQTENNGRLSTTSGRISYFVNYYFLSLLIYLRQIYTQIILKSQ